MPASGHRSIIRECRRSDVSAGSAVRCPATGPWGNQCMNARGKTRGPEWACGMLAACRFILSTPSTRPPASAQPWMALTLRRRLLRLPMRCQRQAAARRCCGSAPIPPRHPGQGTWSPSIRRLADGNLYRVIYPVPRAGPGRGSAGQARKPLRSGALFVRRPLRPGLPDAVPPVLFPDAGASGQYSPKQSRSSSGHSMMIRLK